MYTEVRPREDHRTYLCNCYGVVELAAGPERLLSESTYHQAFWCEPAPVNGRLLTPAGLVNHTDQELEFLAQLVGQRTTWQETGRRGTKGR